MVRSLPGRYLLNKPPCDTLTFYSETVMQSHKPTLSRHLTSATQTSTAVPAPSTLDIATLECFDVTRYGTDHVMHHVMCPYRPVQCTSTQTTSLLTPHLTLVLVRGVLEWIPARGVLEMTSVHDQLKSITKMNVMKSLVIRTT